MERNGSRDCTEGQVMAKGVADCLMHSEIGGERLINGREWTRQVVRM